MGIEIISNGDGFRLEAQTTVAAPRDDVFPFFANAGNLERLTPPQLKFKVLTPQPIEMDEGTLIDYQLRVHGIPLKWQSEISVWEPPHRFVDEQRRGPYRHWIHEHRFEARDGATVMFDTVDYAAPGGWLVNSLFVARDLRKIFAFREAKMREIFPG